MPGCAAFMLGVYNKLALGIALIWRILAFRSRLHMSQLVPDLLSDGTISALGRDVCP